MILYYIPDDLSGSGMYRAGFPADELRRRGHRCYMPKFRRYVRPMVDGRMFEIAAYKGTNRQLRRQGVDEHRAAYQADIIVLPRPLKVERVARTFHKAGKPVVADTDDLYLDVGADHPMAENENAHTAFLDTFKWCDLVTCSTQALADEYRPYADTVVIRNALHPKMWEGVAPQYEVQRPRLRIGYMGTTEFHARDLRVIADVIGPWLRDHPDVDFVAAGDRLIHELLDVPPAQRITYGPVSLPDLASITATMDIGLVPLARNRFNEAKSSLKGMEYAICGIPCIATPTAEYKWFCRHGATGFLAETSREWRAALDRLLDPVVRRAIGATAREHALGNHMISQRAVEWENTYTDLLKERGWRPAAIPVTSPPRIDPITGRLSRLATTTG